MTVKNKRKINSNFPTISTSEFIIVLAPEKDQARSRCWKIFLTFDLLSVMEKLFFLSTKLLAIEDKFQYMSNFFVVFNIFSSSFYNFSCNFIKTLP